MKSPAQVTATLKRRLGAVVDISEKGRWAASFDSSKISFLPDAVITPLREEQIGVVLALANRHPCVDAGPR
jgi:glycolate oxidase